MRRDISYRMPAEWEKHRATWLAWPENQETWPGMLLCEVQAVYVQMIHELLSHERVHLIVRNKSVAKIVQGLLLRKSKVQRLCFHEIKVQDVWVRDFGPIFVKQGRKIAYTKWIFNAWGGKYRQYLEDNRTVNQLRPLKKMKRLTPGIVLEGGSIDVNGRGMCLTTEQCLLNPNRNSWLKRGQIEEYLKRYLGVLKVIWLKAGIAGDDTDGHVDDIARFVGPSTVLAAYEKKSRDTNYACLKENWEILRVERNLDQKRIKVIQLPMPEKVLGKGGKRLPASYANFYIANGLVLVPVFGDPNDKKALKIIKSVFPGRKVVGIYCRSLIQGLGAIHCVTQQEPA